MNDIKDVISKFPPEVVNRYDFSKAMYKGALVRIAGCVCPEHGEFSQYAAQFRKGRGCPECGNKKRVEKRRMSPEKFIEDCKTIHSDRAYDYTNTTYVRMTDKITVRCSQHGVFKITALKHYYEAQGCSLCEQEAKKTRIIQYQHLAAQAKIDKTAQNFFNRCAEAHNHRYTYPEQKYGGAKTLIRVICSRHGEFLQGAWRHLNGSGCPKCGQKSSQELVLKEYLESLGAVVIHRDRKILAPKELDLWLPEHNIGIEYHGLHWHTVNRVGNAHREKWELANSVGVRIIQIFEDEWLNKQDIVKARLRAIVGKSNKIFARKTEVKTIEFSQAREFLEARHIQGAGTAAKAYGLFHQKQLVAVATFGKSRTGGMTAAKGSKWEVIRYASEGTVVGGFTKLFSAFLRQYTPEEVISYCDLRYGIGGVYKAAGFHLQGITEPDYWWVPNGKVQRVPRYQTQKHKLRTHPELGTYYVPEKSEAEICADAGWQKIMGVGNQKWVYTTNN